MFYSLNIKKIKKHLNDIFSQNMINLEKFVKRGMISRIFFGLALQADIY